MDGYTVNGLALPTLLVELLESGQWHHPGDDVISALIPCLREPVDFLTLEEMRRESVWRDHIPNMREVFCLARGSRQSAPIELPWLDVERAFCIAVNRFLGDDIAIALDYRTDPRDPRVVASEWRLAERRCVWREVAPTFSEFVQHLKLR